MKKILIVFLVLVVLLVGAMVAIPFLFKDKLVAYAKDAANEQINATVDFGEFDLSLFRSFPNLSFRIEDVTVDNKAPFEKVRLAEIGALEFTINLMPLLGGNVVINEFGVLNSKFDVRILEDGTANYDITKESEDDSVAEAADTSSSEYNIELKRYYFQDIDLVYDDVPLLTKVVITDMDHEGTGDFTQDLFVLSTKTTIAAMDVDYDGITYLKKARLSANADLDIDANHSKYTLKQNTFELNELTLGVDGWVAMPEDPIDMDLTFEAREAEFRHFLSLVPAEFASDLEGVDVSGTLGFTGYAKGTYTDEAYPGFGIDLKISDGRFKYPDLPSSAERIAVACKIDHPGGDLDLMVIDLSRFHVELANNPFDLTLLLKHPMTDPDIKADLVADLDFANVGKVVPMEEELQGSLKADVHFKGRYSAIEQERYEDFEAGGNLALRDFAYTSEDGYDMTVQEAALSFTPRYAQLSKLDLTLNGTDLSAQGRLENYIAYALKDSLLIGQLSLQSKKVDLNPFMAEDEGEGATTDAETGEEEAYAAPEIPSNIDFTLNASIDELLYEDLTMRNVKGGIQIAGQQVRMKDVHMDVLQGHVKMNGTYDGKIPEKPTVDFAYDVDNLDINETATAFVTVQKYAPLAKKATGKFSTDMTFTAELDSALNPILSSVYGKGHLQSKSVYIKGFEPLNELAKVLKIDRLKEQNIQDVNFAYEIINGRAYVKPFDVKIDKINTNVSGSTGLDQTLDYVMKMNIPTEMLKGGAMDMVQGFMGQAAAFFGQEFKMDDNIKMDVLVSGTVEKPIFKPSFGGMTGTGQSAADMAKDKIKEELDKAKDEALAKAIAEAEAQAAKLVEEAQKQADKVRSEAKKQADKVRSEGRAAAKKLEDEASNPFAKAAAREAGKKLIQEADKNADKIEAEADKQGQKLVDEAKKRGDQLIEEARTKVE